MIEICMCILCAVLIFLTWRTEVSKTKINRLEDELSIAQREIRNLKEQKDEQKYQ